MKPRLPYAQLAPAAFRALAGLEQYIAQSSIEKPLRELVKLRASQINGCAYCIDMHWKDARAAGETEQRLYGLGAWAESPYYTDRERAALAWAGSVTLVADTHLPEELVDLTWAVAAINARNRMAVAMRAEAGTYQPQQHG